MDHYKRIVLKFEHICGILGDDSSISTSLFKYANNLMTKYPEGNILGHNPAEATSKKVKDVPNQLLERIIIIIIIMNFYSPVSNTRCHSIGHKMRIARIKIRVEVDSPGRWERA